MVGQFFLCFVVLLREMALATRERLATRPLILFGGGVVRRVLLLTCVVLPISDALSQGIEEIRDSWLKSYGDFAERNTFHYRCTTDVSILNKEVSLESLDVPYWPLAIEVFRSGKRTRCTVFPEPGFSSLDKGAMSYVFDGTAAYIIDHEIMDAAAYPVTDGIRQNVKEGAPKIDFLASFLGLPALMSETAWTFHEGPSRGFDISSALKIGDYDLKSDDGDTIKLVASGIDEIWLSRSHGYAVSRRIWHWDEGQSVRWSVENRDWQQFEDGTWFPAASDFTQFNLAEAMPSEPVFKTQFRFTAMPSCEESDFLLVADKPGWSVRLEDPSNYGCVFLEEGDSYELPKVASGEISLAPPDGSELERNAVRMVIWVNIVLFVVVVSLEAIRRRMKKSKLKLETKS